MRPSLGLGDAEFGTDLGEGAVEQGLVVSRDVAGAFQSAFDGPGEEFGGIRACEHCRDGLDTGEGQHAHFEEQERSQQR